MISTPALGPDLPSGLDDEFQLAALVLRGEQIALGD
jgi:hypothetical protein